MEVVDTRPADAADLAVIFYLPGQSRAANRLTDRLHGCILCRQKKRQPKLPFAEPAGESLHGGEVGYYNSISGRTREFFSRLTQIG